MTPMQDQSIDWQRLACQSVERRGFHSVVPGNVQNTQIATQFVRLTEEVCEYLNAPEFDKLKEAADVCIVAANIAELTESRVSLALRYPVEGHGVLQSLEKVARAMRGMPARQADMEGALDALVSAVAVHASYRFGEGALLAAILAKLQADEGRGFLHNAGQSIGNGSA